MYSRSGIDAACSYEQWRSVRLLHILAGDWRNRRTQFTLYTTKLCSTLTGGDKCAISREWQREESPSATETNGTNLKFTFVLMWTAAFNYTSEIVTEWRRSLTERCDVQCEWILTGESRFFIYVSFFTHFFRLIVFLFLVALFFLQPFLHFYFSYHLPIHSFISTIHITNHTSICPSAH
jgi:hypothetical protein